MFKLHDLVVKIYVGNLEAFAFPNKPEEQECISNDIENIQPLCYRCNFSKGFSR